MSDFKAKMHQNQFLLGLRPKTSEEAYSTPKPLAGFNGPTSKGREGRGRENGIEDREGREKRRENPVPDWESEKVATI